MKADGIMAEVVATSGRFGYHVRDYQGSAEALGLKEGDTVTANIESTEVMIEKSP